MTEEEQQIAKLLQQKNQFFQKQKEQQAQEHLIVDQGKDVGLDLEHQKEGD